MRLYVVKKTRNDSEITLTEAIEKESLIKDINMCDRKSIEIEAYKNGLFTINYFLKEVNCSVSDLTFNELHDLID